MDNKIQLASLTLIRYNDSYKDIKEELVSGYSKSEFINEIGKRLEGSRNSRFLFQSAFLVVDKHTPIGYVYFSGVSNDEVFLECSILSNYRGKGYSKRVLNEVSEYLFNNHNIMSVKLDISPNNELSIKSAMSCGFYPDEEDYEKRNYGGKIVFVKDSDCYEMKRRIK